MDDLRKFTMWNIIFLLRIYVCACVFILVFLLPLSNLNPPKNKIPMIVISLIKTGQLQRWQ